MKRRAESPIQSSKTKIKKLDAIKSQPSTEIDSRDVEMQSNSQFQDDNLSDSSPALDRAPLAPTYFNREISLESLWGKQWHLRDVPQSCVFYHPGLIDEQTANQWYQELCNLETWYHPTLKLYGKSVIQGRAIAAYATSPELSARYSGHNVTLHTPYPPLLQEIQNRVSEALGVGFDHVMLNRYEDGSIYIGKHRDVKENQVIASLSLGCPRTFVMTPHVSKGQPKVDSQPFRWVLENGSIFVMQGDTQENWKHEILKEPKIKAGRISLTFRQLVRE